MVANEYRPNLRILKGTRDYTADEQIIREYIVDTLKTVFKLYGYKPIETSILEFYDIASSKYAGGDEILKEVYKLKDQGSRDLCLRYELTFKLAKFIALNPNIRLPFKRYEIGKVFRDGPVKKGRLREFTQCDVDCIGIPSSEIDAEFMAMIFDVFSRLGLNIYVQLNNRKILFGLFELIGFGQDKDRLSDLALSLDKLEKFGKDYVIEELKKKGFDLALVINLFKTFDEISKYTTNEEKISYIEKLNARSKNNPLLTKGLSEIKEFFSYLKSFLDNQDNNSNNLGLAKNLAKIIFTPTLARGLSYYTGMMWEVYLEDGEIKSSVAAGGRWDDMISNFIGSSQKYPASGMTFGLDVIYEALKPKIIKEQQLKNLTIPKVLIIPINTIDYCIKLCSKLRNNNISCDIAYNKKLTKALDYANKESIPYCIIIGDEELRQNSVKLRDMQSGEERLIKVDKISNLVDEIK